MSDIFLTTIAFEKANKSLEEVVKEYNDPELTIKGKRDALLNSIAFSFIAGFKLAKDEVDKKDARIKELEGLVEKAILKKDFSNYSSFLDSLKQNGFSFFIAMDMGDSIKYQIYNDIESEEEEIKSNYDLLCACENIAKAYGERIKELGINNE